MLNTSTPVYISEDKAGCYVWRNDKRIEWIEVDIPSAIKMYSELLPNEAIITVAKRVFDRQFSQK